MNTLGPHALQIAEPLEERQAENGVLLVSNWCYDKLPEI